jgi:hypothetical protein
MKILKILCLVSINISKKNDNILQNLVETENLIENLFNHLEYEVINIIIIYYKIIKFKN